MSQRAIFSRGLQNTNGEKRDKKRIYISGPISHWPGLNRAAFAEAQDALEAVGYEVVNPFDVTGTETDWKRCMELDLAALETCDIMAQLDYWPLSRGARIENHKAYRWGIPAAHWRVWEREARR